MTDLAIIETGSGGDAVLTGSDLAAVAGYENMPYLAMFGGSGDWWGNLLMDGSQLIGSQTEQALQEVALNSAGRIRIEQAINADLDFLRKEVPETKIAVSTSITAPDRLEISITIDGRQFNYGWNPATGLYKNV